MENDGKNEMNSKGKDDKDHRLYPVVWVSIIAAVAITFAVIYIGFGNMFMNAKKTSDAGVNSTAFTTLHVKDFDDNDVDSSVFKGHKVTVVNIWATFCSPCIGEIPTLDKLNKEYSDKGLQVIGICGDIADSSGKIDDAQMKSAQKIVSEAGASYLQLVPDESLNKSYIDNNVIAYPTTLFLDEDGNIIDRVIGANEEKDWKTKFDANLKKVSK